MARFVDDVGAEVPLPKEVLRVVSLVPSLTEASAFSHPKELVAATDWCTHPADLDVLRALGIPVWVTDIRTVDQALASIETLLRAVGISDTGWLDQARNSWAQTPVVMECRRLRAVVPIWRRPWMHLGSDTYAGDVLRRLGVDNVLSDSPERYPKLGLEHLPEVDLVVLPDEPYLFTETDGPKS